MAAKKENKNNVLIYSILGATAGFFIADYLKSKEIDELKKKITANPGELTTILKEGGGILKTLQAIFKK